MGEQAAMEALLGPILVTVVAPFDTLVLFSLGMLALTIGPCQKGMALRWPGYCSSRPGPWSAFSGCPLRRRY